MKEGKRERRYKIAEGMGESVIEIYQKGGEKVKGKMRYKAVHPSRESLFPHYTATKHAALQRSQHSHILYKGRFVNPVT